jgi:hypothetical protein
MRELTGGFSIMQEVLPVERLVRDAKRSETIVRRSQLAHSRRVAARTTFITCWPWHKQPTWLRDKDFNKFQENARVRQSGA